ncbi:MAG: hypothetical protein ACRC2P_06180, partial [Eubacterium aggregans]
MKGKVVRREKKMGLSAKPMVAYCSYGEVGKEAFRQLNNLVRHSVILTLAAQKMHVEMVPRT